jgi:uncharacterized protein (DUF952 family)
MTEATPETIYKIITRAAWAQALADGVFRGAAIDLRDGYIHLSTEAQVKDTARLHFAGQVDLLLVAFDVSDVGDALRWEPSRGGALFPHVYGALNPALARFALPLPWNGSTHDFPKEVA